VLIVGIAGAGVLLQMALGRFIVWRSVLPGPLQTVSLDDLRRPLTFTIAIMALDLPHSSGASG